MTIFKMIKRWIKYIKWWVKLKRLERNEDAALYLDYDTWLDCKMKARKHYLERYYGKDF